jgi:hypothetical protein
VAFTFPVFVLFVSVLLSVFVFVFVFVVLSSGFSAVYLSVTPSTTLDDVAVVELSVDDVAVVDWLVLLLSDVRREVVVVDVVTDDVAVAVDDVAVVVDDVVVVEWPGRKGEVEGGWS